MPLVIPPANNLSAAWASAFTAVLESGGKAVNLVASWRGGAAESPAVRVAVDAFLGERRREHLKAKAKGKKHAWPVWSVETVANTIFPIDLYFAQKGDDAITHFTALYLEGREFARSVSPEGEYCERLVAWPGRDGPVNQLDVIGAKFRKIRDQNRNARGELSSDYEIAIDHPADAESIRVQVPGMNNGRYGFPCLSHISLTIHNAELHLTATYRNQHLTRKGYGNYLGLSRLGTVMSHEVGLPLGEVVVVSTHADVEIGTSAGFGRRALESLAETVQSL